MALLRLPIVQKPYQLLHYYFLLEKRPGLTLADLNFDTNPRNLITKFKRHNWTVQEITHYLFLVLVILFVYIIFPASILIKTGILAAFTLCFLIPLTLQFFVHALPIFTWLALYFSCGKIPNSWKPPISVVILPAMETILYGDNLLAVLATTHNTILDIAAWLPYGIIHFSAPFVVAAFIFVFAPPTLLRLYGFAFGYMNLLGVLTQIMFPAAPPWYKILHGLEPANYGMLGSPGGLGRIDKLLNVDMYTTTFSNSPVIFGAFPSLHSGCSVMDVLFLCWLFPKFVPVWFAYALWLWWLTMYLTHHYFIDLIGGAALSLLVFTYTKYMHLPLIDHTKFCRWLYTRVEKIDVFNLDPIVNFHEVADLEAGDSVPLQDMRMSMRENVRGISGQRRSVLLAGIPEVVTESTVKGTKGFPLYKNGARGGNMGLNSLLLVNLLDDRREETSSMEQLAVPLVFDEGRSLNALQTLLDE